MVMRRTALRAKSHYKPVELRWFHDWVADQGCLVCGFEATLHHVTGYADRPGRFGRDHWLVVPLCPAHHQKVFDPCASDPISVEGLGHQGFFEKYGIDLLAEAMSFAEQWQRKDAA
jgi:hypothetical protein